MSDASSLHTAINASLHPDFKLDYNNDIRISPQDYLISNLTRIGRICLTNQNYTPSIVMLDGKGILICNHQFKIKHTPGIDANSTANVHIDIISDYNPDRKLFYTVVHDADATASATGDFGFIKHEVPFSEIPFSQHQQVVDYITSDPVFKQRYAQGFATQTLVHAIDFTAKTWTITGV